MAQYVDVTCCIETHNGDELEITLCCATQEGCIERVTVYLDFDDDVPLPAAAQEQLQRWAEYYVDVDPHGRIADAYADAEVKLWDGRPW